MGYNKNNQQIMNELIYKVNGEILNDFQTEKFKSFYDYLSKNSKYAKIIYRGENYSNLKEKLNLSGDCDYFKLSQTVFLIGEKGRVYRTEYKNKIMDKSKIYPIDYIGEDLFNKIFDKFNSILLNKNNNPIIENFISNNLEFSDYFKSKSDNKKKFTSRINAIDNCSEKIKVRDYYLSLLHKIGNIGFYNNSFFLSTTTKFKEAIRFAENPENSSKIIFVSWIKYPLNNIGINFNYLNLFKNRILQIGLPFYEKTFFPSQAEISIKGGLLPHFILGYVRLEEKIFEINPNFFSSKKSIKNTIKNGFDIDQENFSEFLNKTDYSGFFTLNNNKYLDFNN